MRSSLCAGILLVALLFASACTAQPHSAAEPSASVPASSKIPSSPLPSAASGSSALTVISSKVAYQIPAKSTEVITDGSLVVRNISSTPLRLVSVLPIFQNNQASEPGVTVTGIKVAPLLAGNEDFVSIQRIFPPSREVESVWKDISGQMVEPSADVPAYVLFFGLQVSAGSHHLSAVRITFEANGNSFTAEFERNTTVCHPASATSTHC